MKVINDLTRATAMYVDCGRYRVYWGDNVDGYVIWDCRQGCQIMQTGEAHIVFDRLYSLSVGHRSAANQITQIVKGVSHDGIYHPVVTPLKNPYE